MTPEFKELIRSTNAGIRDLFEKLQREPSLAHHKATLDTTFATVTTLLDGSAKISESEERRNTLLREYSEMRMAAIGDEPKTVSVWALRDMHSQLLLKLDAWLECQEREKTIHADIGRSLETFIQSANDLYSGPLRAHFLFLVPVVANFLNAEQRQMLAKMCPHVEWPPSPSP